MELDEAIAALTGVEDESFPHDAASVVIESLNKIQKEYNDFKENSSSKVESLNSAIAASNSEINKLKTQNYDLMMKQPGAPIEDKAPKEPVGISDILTALIGKEK